MTQVPEISYGALRAITVDEDVRERAAEALHRAVIAEYGSSPYPWNDQMRPETMRMFRRQALAVIKELQRIVEAEHVELELPRDWRVNEIDPGTPYADESTEMIPPDVYLAAGFTDDPEDGPGLILRVEQVSGGDDAEDVDMVDVARRIADRLNGGSR